MEAIPILLLLTFANGERLSWTNTVPKQDLFKHVGPPPKPIPMYLGPYPSDGIINPMTGLRPPVDLLSMIMYRPKTEEEKRRILMTVPLSRIQFIEKITSSPIFYNAGDKMLTGMQNGTNENREPMYYNYEALNSRNFNRSPYEKEPLYRYQVYRSKHIEEMKQAKTQPKSKVDLEAMSKKQNCTFNWTTCEEFKKKSNFHPKYLLDIDWLTFYTWTEEEYMVSYIYKFRSAPRKMVVRMKTELGNRFSRNVDWNQPKLVMENQVRTSLLIAVDQTGLFHEIRDEHIPDYFKQNKELKYPTKLIRIKIVNQYVAMMDCEVNMATIMAPIEDVPKTDAEKEKAATVLKFTGKGIPVSRDLTWERNTAEARKAVEERKAVEDTMFSVKKDEDYVEGKEKPFGDVAK